MHGTTLRNLISGTSALYLTGWFVCSRALAGQALVSTSLPTCCGPTTPQRSPGCTVPLAAAASTVSVSWPTHCKTSVYLMPGCIDCSHTLPIPCFKHSAPIPQALPARSVALLHCNNPPRAETQSHQRKPSQLKVSCVPASHAPTTLSHEHELQPALPRNALAAAIEGAVRQRVALLSGASSRPDTGIAASFVVREVYTNSQVRVGGTTAFIHSFMCNHQTHMVSTLGAG